MRRFQPVGIPHAACVAVAVLGGAPASRAQSFAPPAEVRFPLGDSLAVVADVHRAGRGMAGPAILLFHQAGGSARGEYRAIVPRLLHAGYNVVAADIRGGGDRFGEPNRVGASVGAPGDFHYCDALGEVEATVDLARAQGFTGPLVLWGSSYSAALVLQAAARRSVDVRAVLAFSPASGEPMRGCEPAGYVAGLRRAGVAALVVRPAAEVEDSGRAAQLEAMRRDGAEVFIAKPGVHGSSTLDPERVKGDTEPAWTTVLDFLRRTVGSP